MPTLADTQSDATPIKGMLLGDSGVGKTGALWSLVMAGYRLHILDFDKGLDILLGMSNDPKQGLTPERRKALLGNITFETCQDPYMVNQGRMIPSAATAWTKAMSTMDRWKISALTSNDIFVMDSLTFGGKACLRHVLAMNSRLHSTPWNSDYFQAQGLLENLLGYIYADAVKCHVLILTHIRQQGIRESIVDDKQQVKQIEIEGTRKGFPETGTGRALSPTVGRYFNTMLLCDIMGSGPSAQRVIRTVPHENIGLKNPSPGLIAPSYPLATGLASIFTTLRGGAKPEAS